eukprot:4309317-Pyramimonas_sp.AAC.1
MEAPGMRGNIMVAHGPHSGHRAEEVRLAARWPPRFVFIDPNGQVGNIASETIGDQGPKSEEDLAGSLLHDFYSASSCSGEYFSR